MNSPVEVRRWRALSRRAIPKSVTLASPDGSTITFAGLMSRWTTPFLWAWSSARATWATMRATTGQATGPSSRARSASVWPRSSSSAMKSAPVAESRPTSCTTTIPGW